MTTKTTAAESDLSPEHMSNVMQTARQVCAASGTRLTEKRQKVLETLVTANTPLSAYELVERHNQLHTHCIQAMSVYRILEFLESEHLVHRLNLNNKYVACSHIRCCQEHGLAQFMICTQCDKVQEATMPAEIIDALNAKVSEAGFALTGPHLELACICNECRTEQASN